MKKTNDPFMKLRIIIASGILVIILGGWVLYGYIFLKTNPAKILTNLSETEKENINNFFSAEEQNKEKNIDIILDNDKTIHIYSNIPEGKLYIYNDKEYYSLINSDTKTKPQVYKDIIYSLIDSFTYNYKILDVSKKRDDKKGYYIYSFSLNELYPLLNTLKTDKVFIDSLKNSFKLSDKNIAESLDKYNDSAIGLNIVTKGRKRDIVYYNLKIDNLFDIYKEGDYISGFFLDYGFTYDNSLIVYTEDNEYHAVIQENNNTFNIENYKESTLEQVLSII